MGNMNDTSANKLTGAAASSYVAYVSDRFGMANQAVRFVNKIGVPDYLVLSASALHNADDFSLHFFLKFSQLNRFRQTLLMASSETHLKELLIFAEPDGVTYNQKDVCVFKAAFKFAVNKYYQVAFVRSGSNHIVYVNGRQVATNACAAKSRVAIREQHFIIGQEMTDLDNPLLFDPSVSFYGQMDEIYTYLSALTKYNIQQFYAEFCFDTCFTCSLRQNKRYCIDCNISGTYKYMWPTNFASNYMLGRCDNDCKTSTSTAYGHLFNTALDPPICVNCS